jgi:hypothetical protein
MNDRSVRSRRRSFLTLVSGCPLGAASSTRCVATGSWSKSRFGCWHEVDEPRIQATGSYSLYLLRASRWLKLEFGVGLQLTKPPEGLGHNAAPARILGKAKAQRARTAACHMTGARHRFADLMHLVSLTSRGRDLIAPAFRKHSGQMRKVFSELSSEELRSLEVALKKIGKRAAAVMEQRG